MGIDIPMGMFFLCFLLMMMCIFLLLGEQRSILTGFYNFQIRVSLCNFFHKTFNSTAIDDKYIRSAQ